MIAVNNNVKTMATHDGYTMFEICRSFDKAKLVTPIRIQWSPIITTVPMEQ